ncbi:mitogen-activated protein kinase [Perkinsela sp. CCAP 1560/4]|nr:mitogen-activated protein kinase [Perkinsela sp. CCAP 1560/4]|eukprot:KNH04672.1 mitogen-activated protein kinase [Perkinsela sp. CCAP 1560/4]
MARRKGVLSLEEIGLQQSQESLITNTMTLQVELRICPDGENEQEQPAVTERIRVKENGVENIRGDRVKVPFQSLKVGPILGEGSQAKVRKALHFESGKLYALKQFTGTGCIDSMKKLFEIELRKVVTIPFHENLVNSVEAFFRNGHFMILMEYVKHGTLREIYLRRNCLTEDELQIVSRHLFRGLCYLEKCGIVHRDIKPSNILISEDGIAKISDFGISTYVNASFLQSTIASVGSHPYMAPERMRGDPYSFNSDVWSAGLTIAECYLGEYAFGGKYKADSFSLCNQLTNGKPLIQWKPGTSRNFIDFVEKCLIHDPRLRPSAATLLNHPFIATCSSDNALRDLVSTL